MIRYQAKDRLFLSESSITTGRMIKNSQRVTQLSTASKEYMSHETSENMSAVGYVVVFDLNPG